jgi:hypothetical protein
MRCEDAGMTGAFPTKLMAARPAFLSFEAWSRCRFLSGVLKTGEHSNLKIDDVFKNVEQIDRTENAK